MTVQHRPDQISEESAALLLDRAAQIDAAGGKRVSVDELREVAIEAGISPEAFERAIAEIWSVGVAPVPARASAEAVVRPSRTSPAQADEPDDDEGVPPLVYRAGILGSGLAIGAFSLLLAYGAELGEAGTYFCLFLALLVAIGLMRHRRSERAVFDFALDFAMLWTGVTFMLMLGAPGFADQILGMMGALGAIVGGVGGIVVAVPASTSPDRLPERT